MRRIRIGRNERGAALPFVALTMTVTLGFTSFAVDMAFLYTRKQAHVNADDAGALAGAQAFMSSYKLSGSKSTAARAAEVESERVVTMNGVKDVDAKNYVIGQFNGPCKAQYPIFDCLDVMSSEQSPLFFARIFGRQAATVGAKSTMIVGAPNVLPWQWVQKLHGLKPWGLPYQTFSNPLPLFNPANPPITNVKTGSLAEGVTAGNTYPVRLFMGPTLPLGSGLDDHRWLIQNGSVHDYEIGRTMIESETGNMGINTGKGIYDLIRQDVINPDANNPTSAEFRKGCRDVLDFYQNGLPPSEGGLVNIDGWTSPCKRVIILPIVDWTKSGNTALRIEGFGLIFLMGTNYVPKPNILPYQKVEYRYYKGPNAGTGVAPDGSIRPYYGTLNGENNGDYMYGVFLTGLKLTSDSEVEIDPNVRGVSFSIDMAELVN